MNDRRILESLEANLAANLRRLREARGLSQGQVAKEMQSWGLPYVRQTTISRMEKGEQSLRVAEALALTAIFDASLEELVSPEGDVDTFLSELTRRADAAYRSAYDALAAYEMERRTLLNFLQEHQIRARGRTLDIANTSAIDLAELIPAPAEAARRG